MSHDNLKMTRFVEGEMILKTTLLKCDTNILVSCVISLEKKLQSLMISNVASVVFFTKANLCCIDSLSMKHIVAFDSNNG